MCDGSTSDGGHVRSIIKEPAVELGFEQPFGHVTGERLGLGDLMLRRWVKVIGLHEPTAALRRSGTQAGKCARSCRSCFGVFFTNNEQF
jgi:hypothetical protein